MYSNSMKHLQVLRLSSTKFPLWMASDITKEVEVSWSGMPVRKHEWA